MLTLSDFSFNMLVVQPKMTNSWYNTTYFANNNLSCSFSYFQSLMLCLLELLSLNGFRWWRQTIWHFRWVNICEPLVDLKLRYVKTEKVRSDFKYCILKIYFGNSEKQNWYVKKDKSAYIILHQNMLTKSWLWSE